MRELECYHEPNVHGGADGSRTLLGLGRKLLNDGLLQTQTKSYQFCDSPS